MRKKQLLILTALVCAGAMASVSAQGQSEGKFPTKQISIICQASAGGSSDLNCRSIAPGIQEALGVPVTVTNKPGAGGGIGITYGAKATPDGYTITHLPVDVAQLKPAGNADVTPDDFRFLCRVAYHPAAIAVRADSQYKDFSQFINAVKVNPGKISLGNSGIGAIWHLSACQFEQATGVKFSNIPFEGAAPAITALMGGHIDAVVCSPVEVRAQVQSGDLRLLTVFDDERFPLFPDVPTAKELGYDVSVLCWLGFGVPKDTPDDIFNILEAAIKKSYEGETYQKMLQTSGLKPGWLGPEDAQKFAEQEYKKYSQLIPKVLNVSK
jgi:tripartite-type tricarboxylate transporter receptor subunit TctC